MYNLILNNGVYFYNNTFNYIPAKLNYYEETTDIDILFTGIADFSLPIRFVKIGNSVTLYSKGTVFTSTSIEQPIYVDGIIPNKFSSAGMINGIKVSTIIVANEDVLIRAYIQNNTFRLKFITPVVDMLDYFIYPFSIVLYNTARI